MPEAGRIDGFASLPHFAAHAGPVHERLPVARRGEFYALRSGQSWGPRWTATGDSGRSEPVLVASGGDAMRFRHRPVVYMEHGAGQRYAGDPVSAPNPSYIGGQGREHVRLFLTPGEAAADVWRQIFPETPVVAVGCPKLDRWHIGAGRDERHAERTTVALVWHWECELVPETRSAWTHWARHLPAVVAWARHAGVDLIGHGHPRWRGRLGPKMTRLGIDYVDDLESVFSRADVMVCDNSSAMFEFASLGRPVVALNAPWYRRDVEHGGRFWSHIPGPDVDTLDDLLDVLSILVSIGETATWADLRRRAVAHVYARTDGHAAATAAAAIMEVFRDAEPVGGPRLPDL